MRSIIPMCVHAYTRMYMHMCTGAEILHIYITLNAPETIYQMINGGYGREQLSFLCNLSLLIFLCNWNLFLHGECPILCFKRFLK